MDDETLGQLLGIEAESLGYPDIEVVVTPQLERVVDRYEDELVGVLSVFVARASKWPPSAVEDFVDQLMEEGEAPVNVLLTLRGEGAGIWDGRWDNYFTADELKRLQTLLVRRLSKYADETGSGRLNDAMRDAVLQAAGEIPRPFDVTRLHGWSPSSRKLRRNSDGGADVVVTRVGDVAALLPRTPQADRYIDVHLCLGSDFDEAVGGYMVPFSDLNENVALLDAAHFNVVVEEPVVGYA